MSYTALKKLYLFRFLQVDKAVLKHTKNVYCTKMLSYNAVSTYLNVILKNVPLLETDFVFNLNF